MIVTLNRLAKNWHFLLYILSFFCGSAQHKVIEFSDIKNWPVLDYPSLSPDGQYAAYLIRSDAGPTSRLCVRSFDQSAAFEIENVRDFNFAMNSRFLVYSVEGKESITIVDLNTQNRKEIDSVRSYQFIRDRTNDWLLMLKSGLSNVMAALNLSTGKHFEYDSIASIRFWAEGRRLIVEKKSDSVVTLEHINLRDGIQRTIWSGKKVQSFESNERTLQFFTRTEDQSGNLYVDVYQLTEQSVNHLFRRRLDSLNVKVERIQGLSKDSRFLFFYARNPLETNGYTKDTLQRYVRIWSYLDQQLKTVRDQTHGRIQYYLYAVSLSDGAVHRIEQPNEQAAEIGPGKILIRKQEGDCHVSDANWNKACSHGYYLLSTTDFKRSHIPALDNQQVSASPEGKYLLYFDYRLKAYYAYSISTGQIYPVTKGINGATWTSHASKVVRGVAGWLPDDQLVLLYDRYDIYAFDPTGKKDGYCLTDGIGEKTKTVFALSFNQTGLRPFKNRNELLLTALNTVNKDNGFYKVTIGGDLQKLSFGPYLFDVSQVKSGTDFPPAECNFVPVKAQFADVYLIKRMTASEFGNLYLTKDFIHLKKISDLHPERGFNWYTSELHSWRRPDSTLAQGILYKPYDFDSTKKYPVIFHYYDRKSDGLHAYITPDALYYGASINIPYYVSRGYLVALVDIDFKTGYTGKSALQTLESAAGYFGEFAYVDSTRLGIEGFSFAGYLTYYLVTHTKKFAAASAGAGLTDLISQFGTLSLNTFSQHELSQYRMGSMLWERPDLFVENSPVMVSSNIETPLLMMNTTHDGLIGIGQSIELFTALRRQGKKVWFLEYLEGIHGVGGESALDYCVRQQEFFDHYLKGKPMPEWMTKEN
ncbi:Dipeptidyl aminopeptidase/acylaminoacyl peptidase [Chryseobacterium wanjuense]|uniref:Dipeptidyl aminopeptidase/acylaminoacyl peptidase n=1 Tax=Chryseobacterium wanjuense TaxID=356305 RepID=A0A1I0QDG0_9FLAO|nr:prolyl oligopeptidase family serine peptidase [Chryseobacterium wanjuense]SEW24860.1 Dipeptidyl aminopeptidase/acylaminoacyl peptidase [Chryseobacterium wanjuense]